MLPRDIDDRTVYTILAKPVPRFEYVVGKIAGVLLLLAISTLVMAAAFMAVLYMREQAVLQATANKWPARHRTNSPMLCAPFAPPRSTPILFPNHHHLPEKRACSQP